MNNYERIAPFYTFLKNLIFGNTLGLNEVIHLNKANPNSTLLVLGSGNCDFLKYLKYSLYQNILCVDKSLNMCQLANKRIQKLGIRNVEIQCADIRTFVTDKQFDFISIPYLLDCLDDENIEYLLNKCQSYIKNEGHLIVSDFRKDQNTVLIRFMYLFFKFLTRIERNYLPDYNRLLMNNNWEVIEDKVNGNSPIFSAKYQKIFT